MNPCTSYGEQSQRRLPRERKEKKGFGASTMSSPNVLISLLATNDDGFLIRSNGDKVPVNDLDGKIVGIYFTSNYITSCREFTQKLKEIYNRLKAQGEDFEIVTIICHEEDEESFTKGLEGIPWLAVPFGDERVEKLWEHFNDVSFPTLAVAGRNGETIISDASYLIDEYGIHAYPFSPEKLAEFEAFQKARHEAQTLESLLVAGDVDFVIGKDGTKVHVSELVGKIILFYFSSQSCPPCRALKPKLIKAYHEIKAKDANFEIIFVSRDQEQSSFDELYSSMPWLALPFGDPRNKSLSRNFKVRCIPRLAAVGPTGKTITNDASGLVMILGSEAYPFTDEHVEEIVKRWPQRLKHLLHDEHELELTPGSYYTCDGCNEDGDVWSFACKACDFCLHPKCALTEEAIQKGDSNERNGPDVDEGSNQGHGNDGWICNREVCYKV